MAITRYEPWSLLNQLQRELQGSQDEKTSEGSIANHSMPLGTSSLPAMSEAHRIVYTTELNM